MREKKKVGGTYSLYVWTFPRSMSVDQIFMGPTEKLVFDPRNLGSLHPSWALGYSLLRVKSSVRLNF